MKMFGIKFDQNGTKNEYFVFLEGLIVIGKHMKIIFIKFHQNYTIDKYFTFLRRRGVGGGRRGPQF